MHHSYFNEMTRKLLLLLCSHMTSVMMLVYKKRKCLFYIILISNSTLTVVSVNLVNKNYLLNYCFQHNYITEQFKRIRKRLERHIDGHDCRVSMCKCIFTLPSRLRRNWPEYRSTASQYFQLD